MRMIGIIGGMSWASTVLYYERLNRLAEARSGGRAAAELLLRSVDFPRVAAMQAAGEWDALGDMMAAEARRLADAGAGILLIAANTMHLFADRVMAASGLPLVHIADATAGAIRAAGLSRPGLMATAFTMEKPFYTDRLRAAGLTPLIPGDADRAELHRIIYAELTRGIVTDASREAYRAIAARLVAAGADSLIFGCTEIGLLLDAADSPVPVFDTLELHCQAAVAAAFQGD